MANKRREKPMTRVTFSLDPDDYKSLERLALSHERSTAWMIRKSITELLQRHSIEEGEVLQS
jgi:predicted transcriptional regulator